MVSINEERKAAKEAQAVVRSLVPSTPRTETKIAILRKASNVATNAIQIFSSQTTLDAARNDAVMALNAVSGLLASGSLTQETIDRAKYTVEAWLNGLAKK